MTITINKNYDIINNKKKSISKRIQGNNIVLTELISLEDPFAKLDKDMREEVWYWDSHYDY
jgi:hypothetical protein